MLDDLVRRCIAASVTACLLAQLLPARAPAAGAAAAAAETPAVPAAHRAPAADFLATGALRAYAPSDTTEFEFPEEDRQHLARDITVFVIISVFVAYFIVKVFIEKDKEEPPPSGGGKPIPG